MFSILLLSQEFFRTDEISKRTDPDSGPGHVDGCSPERQIIVAALESSRFEHNVDQSSGGDQSEYDRRAEDVTRFEPTAVDPEPFGDVVDPPKRTQGVQCITKA